MSQSASFYKLDRDQSLTVATDANPVLRGASFDGGTATMLAQDVVFYPGFRLVEIIDHTTIPAPRRLMLHRPGQAIPLDWTSGPIYALNDAGALRLDDSTVTDYVRFFYQTTRGQHGRFTIVDAVGDVPWHEEPAPAARKSISRMIQPVELLGRTKAGVWRLTACMVYRAGLFRATVQVDAVGHVTLHDQELLVEDLPIRDDVLSQ